MTDPSGFRNPNFAGNPGKIVLSAIESPNYVAGVSGWKINKDGSVEFNNGTFRGTVILSSAGTEILVYSGVPAAGNLLASVSAVATVDAFGNQVLAGFTMYNAQPMNFQADDAHGGGGMGQIFFNATVFSIDNNAGGDILLSAPGGFIHLGAPGAGLKIDTGLPFIFGNGPSGKYFATDRTYSQAAVVTSTFTTVAAIATIVKENNDYANAITAGVFTPPVAAYYDIWHHAVTPAGAVYCAIRKNGVVLDEVSSGGATPAMLTATSKAIGV